MTKKPKIKPCPDCKEKDERLEKAIEVLEGIMSIAMENHRRFHNDPDGGYACNKKCNPCLAQEFLKGKWGVKND